MIPTSAVGRSAESDRFPPALPGVAETGVAAETAAESAAAPVAESTTTAAVALEQASPSPAAIKVRGFAWTGLFVLAPLLWGWMWSAIGVLIAAPILVIVKIFCDHIESLASFGEFLGNK